MIISPRPWTSHERTIGPEMVHTGMFDILDDNMQIVAEHLSEDDANHIINAVNMAWEADCE